MSDSDQPLIPRRGPEGTPFLRAGRKENAQQRGEPPLPSEPGEGVSFSQNRGRPAPFSPLRGEKGRG